jgi:hypothetical protein
MRISEKSSIRLIRLIGCALLLLGVVSALVGPAETYVFRMFQEGGRFHYEGFGFGSLMFANIAIQIAGYYIIAALCIPLGYGHLKLRWWAGEAMETLLIDWLIVGLPLSLLALMILVTSKNVSLASLPLVGLGFILLYPIIPVLLLRFYRSQSVQSAFRMEFAPSCWLSDTPQIRKVAVSLLILITVFLHFPLLLGGVFPLFGRVVLGLPAVLMLDFSILISAGITWGFARRYYWSWWCAVIFLVFLMVSNIVTFITKPLSDIMAEMPFAPVEMEALSGILVHNYYLSFFILIIPAATLIVVVASRCIKIQDIS